MVARRDLGRVVAAAALTITLGVTAMMAAVDIANAQSSARTPEAQYTGKGVEACVRCHGGPGMHAMAETAHGNVDNPRTPYAQEACESCHGPASFHISRARGGVGSPPLLRFGAYGDPVDDQLAACLGCHSETVAGRPGIGWTGTLHDTGRMTCSTCHQVHTNVDALADPAQQRDKCSTCHAVQITRHKEFIQSGVDFKRLTCTTCHAVHELAVHTGGRTR